MRLYILLSFLFLSVLTSKAQPILVTEIIIGYSGEVFNSEISETKSVTALGVGYTAAAPLVTGVLNLSNDYFWKIGNFDIVDNWAVRFNFGMGYPISIYINGTGDYGWGFKKSEDYSSFGMIFGARAFFNLIGPGCFSPMVGMSLFNVHTKIGPTFAEISYVLQATKNNYLMFGFMYQNVPREYADEGKGAKGNLFGLFFSYNY